jgi:hypothetical protein
MERIFGLCPLTYESDVFSESCGFYAQSGYGFAYDHHPYIL